MNGPNIFAASVLGAMIGGAFYGWWGAAVGAAVAAFIASKDEG